MSDLRSGSSPFNRSETRSGRAAASNLHTVDDAAGPRRAFISSVSILRLRMIKLNICEVLLV